MTRPMTEEQRQADRAYWRKRFGLVDYGKLPALDSEGKCDREDCRGDRVPGYNREAQGSSEHVWLYCPQCHCEGMFPLKRVAEKFAPAPEILPRQQVDELEIEVLNLKTAGPAVLDDSAVVYVGRQIEWRGHYLKDSPLRNLYKVGVHGTRAEVCEQYFIKQLVPALEHRKGPIFRELERLAARVRGGERLKLACWCSPERCHGFDLAVAIRDLAREGQ